MALRLPTGSALEDECKRYGISNQGGSAAGTALEFERQQRLLAAWREERDSRLWIVALVSALASLASALAAWTAVATR